ncbi:MNIO family bufferin maturase [Pannonibacter tanglangensis]|uniref:UPF0276 protein GWI71_16580 n=1 Tax=Pannonibacter tanglangensis TaxID=2750084 RepID=A0ABW9ZQS1_9HYPH|nr:DUF692 domain-containing protein [Pannonibacter sp. XCT-34]NBN65309.1 DUF692 family protein [Pannonibacter sp. XCT-34]
MSNARRSRVPSALPARAGAGLKGEHLPAILAGRPEVGFFEIHAENYMEAGGAPHRYLEAIRADYPLSLHGVGLSIGGAGPLDRAHLARLRQVADRYEPGLFSEHLAWSSHDTTCYNDLLPLPYTEATLAQVVAHIDQVQDAMGRQMLLENPSTYVAFAESTIPEAEFLREIACRSGCGLLLDVNNVHVSCTNHAWSAEAYLEAFPLDRVGEIHLGGHAPDLDDDGLPLLIDAHDRAVDAEVWRLLGLVLARTGPLPTLVEWDNDLPAWPVLLDEVRAADRVIGALAGGCGPEAGDQRQGRVAHG